MRKLSISTNTNKDFLDINDGKYNLRFKGVNSLGIEAIKEFFVQTKPFIEEPAAPPEDIFFAIGGDAKTISVPYPLYNPSNGYTYKL